MGGRKSEGLSVKRALAEEELAQLEKRGQARAVICCEGYRVSRCRCRHRSQERRRPRVAAGAVDDVVERAAQDVVIELDVFVLAGIAETTAALTMPAREGEETLVPPTTNQPVPKMGFLLKTQTPVAGLASKERSGVPRVFPTTKRTRPGTKGEARPDWGRRLRPAMFSRKGRDRYSGCAKTVPPAETTLGETLGYLSPGCRRRKPRRRHRENEKGVENGSGKGLFSRGAQFASAEAHGDFAAAGGRTGWPQVQQPQRGSRGLLGASNKEELGLGSHRVSPFQV